MAAPKGRKADTAGRIRRIARGAMRRAADHGPAWAGMGPRNAPVP
ncbi:hypothetical protein [Szabonella alba]|nr:hypothetical protein [Szabonella alba]